MTLMARTTLARTTTTGNPRKSRPKNLGKLDGILEIQRLEDQVYDTSRPDSAPGDAAVTREEFTTRWHGRRDELARLGAQVDGAKLCDEVLADFDAVTAAEDNELITLQGAAERSGYHKDHLRRLARQGKLPVTRRGRRLLFRLGDLPRKPRIIDVQPLRAYDPIADARRVATRRNEGGSHG